MSEIGYAAPRHVILIKKGSTIIYHVGLPCQIITSPRGFRASWPQVKMEAGEARIPQDQEELKAVEEGGWTCPSAAATSGLKAKHAN